jgi:1-aminocyclopropane-1-carboxylate deaminase/D-cysteine desulfhydrase-like pyridoxal-dependent ACC family enzyme
MSTNDFLKSGFPNLNSSVGRLALAQLPTPVREYNVTLSGHRLTLAIKLDNLTSDVYGGNKVRKLEYLLHQAQRRQSRRIATFGTVGSHHALATAIFAARVGLPCTCFLSHQRSTSETAAALETHLGLGTHLVHFGGKYPQRIATLRKHLWGQDACVIPPGGTSWLGTLGFVSAGVELASQVAAGALPAPERLYVATGTMGTAAGLALGLALSGLATEVQAIRVSETWLCNEQALSRCMAKATSMMHRLDARIPADLHKRTKIRLRHDFFAGGYAHSDRATDQAIAFAADQLGLSLEATYTGKALAALLHDLRRGAGSGRNYLFWNTFNSAHGQMAEVRPKRTPGDDAGLPAAFRRYLGGRDGG